LSVYNEYFVEYPLRASHISRISGVSVATGPYMAGLLMKRFLGGSGYFIREMMPCKWPCSIHDRME